jgi:DNA polymerase-3 subunit delta
MVAGEPALKILGGMTFVFRKLARAVELSQQGTTLASALQQAGVFPKEVSNCERYLRRIGRAKAERLLQCLLEADGNLKGGNRLPERLQLERLLVQLRGQ